MERRTGRPNGLLRRIGANALGNAFAYVRFTTYDVRFGEFPRLRASLAKQVRDRIVKAWNAALDVRMGF